MFQRKSTSTGDLDPSMAYVAGPIEVLFWGNGVFDWERLAMAVIIKLLHHLHHYTRHHPYAAHLQLTLGLFDANVIVDCWTDMESG